MQRLLRVRDDSLGVHWGVPVDAAVTPVRSPVYVPVVCLFDGRGGLCGHTMGDTEQRFWVFLVDGKWWI